MKTRKTVHIKQFVRTVMRGYKRGKTQSDVARELGVTPAAVSLRLKYLREIGVNIPKNQRMNRKDIRAAAIKEMNRCK
jgi:predicted transcriptional regulator